jgi:hypothetical protein
MADTGSVVSRNSEQAFPRRSSQERKLDKIASRPTLKPQSLYSDEKPPRRTKFSASEDDISAFKRVLQEIPSNFLLDMPRDIAWSMLSSWVERLSLTKTEAPGSIQKPLYR